MSIKEFTESMKAEIVAIRQIKNQHSLKMLILFHETAIQVAKNQLQSIRGGIKWLGRFIGLGVHSLI